MFSIAATPFYIFLGQKNLEGYSPWSHKELEIIVSASLNQKRNLIWRITQETGPHVLFPSLGLISLWTKFAPASVNMLKLS